MNRKEIKKALALHKSVVPRKTSIPILQCVLLQSADGVLTITSTNLEMAVQTKHSVCVETFTACVNFRSLETLVSALKGNEISLSQNGDTVVVADEKNCTPLPVAEKADDFPNVEFIKTSRKANTADFETLGKLTPFTSTDELRATLMGVLVEADGTAVSTNGHHLAKMQTGLHPKAPVILTSAFICAARKIEADKLKIGFHFPKKENPLVCISAGNCTLQSKCIGGQFPAWRRVLPSSPFGKVEFKAAEIAEPLELYGAMLKNTSAWEKSVVLTFENNEVTISESSELRNDDVIFKRTVPVSKIEKIDGVQTKFNCRWPVCIDARYLTNILTLAGDTTLKCTLHDGGSMVSQLEFVADADGIYTLLMPIRNIETQIEAE